MRNLILGTSSMVALFVLWSFSFSNKENSDMSNNIYDYSISLIDGNPIKLNEFKGKKLLFVNTASKCGFTPQYKDLQALHEAHGDKLVIIGFPCNQFGGQEPGGKEEIKAFCEKNYGVEFLITEKIDVKGAEQHPIYKWLTSEELNGKKNSSVKWNFQKYLIDEEGALIEMFPSTVSPMSDKITSLL